MFPLFPHAGDEMLGQLEACIDYVNARRDLNKPFDILFRGGPLPVDDPARAAEIIAPYEQLGVTWWQLSVSPTSFGKELKGEWPLEEMHAWIVQGPPRW
jgi:hypothetical protein